MKRIRRKNDNVRTEKGKEITFKDIDVIHVDIREGKECGGIVDFEAAARITGRPAPGLYRVTCTSCREQAIVDEGPLLKLLLGDKEREIDATLIFPGETLAVDPIPRKEDLSSNT